jgi:hypothetical protein
MALGDSVRALGSKLTQAQQATADLAFGTGEVVFSSPDVVTIETNGSTVQAQYHGSQPPVGATVNVLFAAGAPIILGVPHGVPPTS